MFYSGYFAITLEFTLTYYTPAWTEFIEAVAKINVACMIKAK